MTDESVEQAVEPVVAEEAVTSTMLDRFVGLRLEEDVGGHYATAANLDELLGELPDTIGLMDLTGHKLTVKGAALHLGILEGKQTLFAVIECVDIDTGEQLAATTGASAVLRQLDRAAQLGLFPFDCKPYQSVLGVKGRTDPLHLGPVDRF